MKDQPQPSRPVTLLGDTETQIWEEMFAHAESHGVDVRTQHYFEVGSIGGDTRAASHPTVVAALCEAAEQGWGLFVPEPHDLGSPGDQLSVLAVAANLGVPAYVGTHAHDWQKTLLPGLATTDVLVVATQGWRMFISEVGARLLTTHLALSLTELGEVA